jgi:aspartyl-tRNA(Asn)/glutamyl-tRNA(Gln) amidotransferase subunit A
MSDIVHWSASELSRALVAKEVSSVEATQAHLDRIVATDTVLGSFLATNDHALKIATASDEIGRAHV